MGEQLDALPMDGLFTKTDKGRSLNFISDREYWYIDGIVPTRITLTWNVNSQIGALTNYDLKKLNIVVWGDSKWVHIPLNVDTVYLNNNNSLPIYNAGISTTAIGSITTIDNIVPDDYLA